MENIINYIIEILINVFDMYIIYRYMTIFFGDNLLDKRLAIATYLGRCVLSFVLDSIAISPFISFVISLICIFLIALCYCANLLKKIIVTIMIFMCGFIAETIVALSVGLSGFDLFGQTVQAGVFYELIIELIFWAITLVVQRFKNINGNMSISKAFIAAIVVIPVSSIYLEWMIFQQKDVNSNMAGISLVCILATNFILIYLYDSLSKMFLERTRAAIVVREKEYYHEQTELLKRRHEELRQFRHDMKNRIVVMQQMLNENQYKSVLEYTEQISEKLNQTDVYSSTGNIAIDSVINYKLTRAAEEGVDVNANIITPDNINIDEDDIVVILGNVLDNAIEATEHLVDNKYINIDLGYDKGAIFIHVENSYDACVHRVNGKFVTRKKDKRLHGIGLQSINAVVQKYNGLLEIENDNQKFTVDILLYIRCV